MTSTTQTYITDQEKPYHGLKNDTEGQQDGHIVTVLLHDYFHRAVFKQCIGEKQWNRFESRLDKNIDDTLALLDAHHVKATFFTLGWIAEKNPEIIRRIAREDHEIANAGYWARSVTEMNPDQIGEDLVRSRQSLEAAGANCVIGFRSAYQWMTRRDLSVLDLLAENGYLYDASYRPAWVALRDEPHRRYMYTYRGAKKSIVEFPVSTASLGGINIPISGGSYLRHFPHRLVFYQFTKWIRNTRSPFVLYFHPWELDPEQPVISAVDRLNHLRQYRNLGKIKKILPQYLQAAPFMPVHKYLGLDLEYPSEVAASPICAVENRPVSLCTTLFSIDEDSADARQEWHPTKSELLPVTVAIPCYNESSSIPYLDRALAELVAEGGGRYDFHFIFVDDCSSDNTVEKLQTCFGHNPKCVVVKHDRNRGVAAALRTGVLNAPTEIVCTIDADCSYDPLELLKMIPLIGDEVDMVTASPYHRMGFVLGVPRWRLFLSRSLSNLYHFLLHHKLSTYTSCFRVCKQSVVKQIKPVHDDFRGIVEQLARLDLAGAKIVEYPTTLQSRIFGASKMKILATILGHLRLITEIIRIKLSRQLTLMLPKSSK